MPDRTIGQRVAEDRLRLAEEQLRAGLWSWERTGNEVTWSAGLYALLRLDPAAVQPSLSLFETLVHPRDRLTLEDTATLATDERQRYRRFRMISPDGQLRWLRGVTQASFDRDGQVMRVLGLVSDITAQEDLQRRHAADRGVLQAVADLMQLSIWRAGEDGRVLDMVSSTLGEPMGIEATAATWRDMVHPEDLPRMAEIWRAAVLRHARYDFTPRVRNPDGSYRTIRAIGLPLERLSIEEEVQLAGVTLFDGRPHTAPLEGDRAVDAGPLSPGQVRAGRGFLNWSADDLAHHANLSVSTVRRLESDGTQRPNAESLRQIRLAFERAGLVLWRGMDGRLCIAGPGSDA